MADLAETTFGDEFPGQGDGGDAAVVEGDHAADASGGGGGSGGGHRLGFGEGVGHGLLAEHVLARFEGRYGDLGVRVPWRTDVDDLYVLALDQPLPVGLRRGPAEGPGRGLGRVRRSARQRRQPRDDGQVEEGADASPGLGVRASHERVPDQPHPDGGFHDSKPNGRYVSTFSLVMVAEASVIDCGTSFSTRSPMPLCWAIRRASLIAEEAIDGL